MARSKDPPPKAGVMASGGEYARDSATQRGAAAIGFDLIASAIETADLGAGDAPLLIADFGAAQGTDSLEPIRLALDALGRRSDGRPVLCVHTDIPGNDFTTLCETLEESPDSYVRDHPEALALMAGRSLFGRCLPAGQLRFGWTASTLHWLSSAPGPVAGHFFVQLSDDADARRAYAARSAHDWRAFLDGRAAELAPGAAVVIEDVAMDGDGVMGSEELFNRLNDALLELGEKRLLSA
ncbi:MAG: hypothetical protein GEU88_10720, partial [Solirubrobacterales bacterium]|nr:hypothetical protein [Solirubrobacterales bacterium]